MGSWDSYIQDQLLATKCIKHAIICGHDANVWAKSSEINVDGADLKTFIGNFNQAGQDNFKTSGCRLGGAKYMYLSSNEKVARFKKGTSGVHTINHTSLHYLLVRGTINARAGRVCYGKVRRLFDSSRLLNQARSFLSNSSCFRLSLFIYNASNL